MPQKRKADQTKLITAAALALAAANGWEGLTLADIARKAQLRVSVVEAHFADIWSIVKHILQQIERDTREELEGLLGASWRDNLLEILMTRLDCAEEHRAAFSTLPRAVLRQPRALRKLTPFFYAAMARTLKDAGMPPTPFRPAAAAALGAIYISVIRAWAKDDTADKSRTLADLDKKLRFFARTLDSLPCPAKQPIPEE